MLERFAKYMIAIFIVIEIGMFTQKGKLGQIEIGRLVASESSLFLTLGLIYSFAVASFLAFVNPFMIRFVRIVGCIGAFLYVTAMVIFSHDMFASHMLYTLAVLFTFIYVIGVVYQLYYCKTDNEKNNDEKGESR
jgi:hypothetical protein